MLPGSNKVGKIKTEVDFFKLKKSLQGGGGARF